MGSKSIKFLSGFVGGSLLTSMFVSWNPNVGSIVAGLIMGLMFMNMKEEEEKEK